ncbi:HRDC domain-containing protein [Actinomycetaceae bacterium TAE3-ERU4]|nr:HRDC domain-containing protein [Actinomycetaceae bacterium TAE3-ERU4]
MSEENPYPIKYFPKSGVPSPIATLEELEEANKHFLKFPGPVAVDAERASGYRYGEPTVLVQIKSNAGKIFLIDTMAIPNLSLLQASLGKTCWILHDAAQDLEGIAQLGLQPAEIFDTAVAARLVGLRRFGLAAVCEQLLGVTLDKNHQADNWSIRPIPRDWLCYAALDVELLHEIHNLLREELVSLNRLSWLEESCEYIRCRPPREPKKDRWRRGSNGVLSTARQLATLKLLYEKRDEIAKKLDVSPGRFLNTAAIVAAARRRPRSRRELAKINGFRSPLVRSYEDEWLDVIEEARWIPETQLPPLKVKPTPTYIPCYDSASVLKENAAAAFEKLRALLQKKAENLDIETVLLATSAQIKHLGWFAADYACSGGEPAPLDDELSELGFTKWQQEIIAPLVRATIIHLAKK